MSSLMRRAFMGSSRTYATWNPADKNAAITLSNGNLTALNTDTSISARATLGKSSGKWYWEVTVNTANYVAIGVMTAAAPLTSPIGQSFTGKGVGYYQNGVIIRTNTSLGTYSVLSGTNVIGIALDLDGLTMSFYKNGSLVLGSIAVVSDTYYAACGEMGADTTGQVTANFGASAFSYTPPSGYNAGLYV